MLRRIYGQAAVRPPTRHWITRWGADEYARGSYSYVAQAAVPEDMDALAEPVNRRLFFAGEATNRFHPATAHGALLSGSLVLVHPMSGFVHRLVWVSSHCTFQDNVFCCPPTTVGDC